jgi:hypothetical protein
LPCSEPYYNNNGQCKQMFSLTFSHGNKLTEIYGIEACWKGFTPIHLLIHNYKWVINPNHQAIYPNILEDGSINGI